MTKQEAINRISQLKDNEFICMILTADEVRTAIKTLDLCESDYHATEVLSTVSTQTQVDMFNNLRWTLENEHADPMQITIKEAA